VARKPEIPERRFLFAVFGDELPEARLAAPFQADGDAARAQLRARILAALDGLSYRERAIVEMRFGLGDGHAYTLAETGYVFRLTRERVRQLQARALRRLRYRADDLRKFLQEFS
jgi:RNA polymerase primary sigma factor